MAVESNCDINERSQSDQSTAAILTVIRRQDPEILEFLAKNNADLNAKNVMGYLNWDVNVSNQHECL